MSRFGPEQLGLRMPELLRMVPELLRMVPGQEHCLHEEPEISGHASGLPCLYMYHHHRADRGRV